MTGLSAAILAVKGKPWPGRSDLHRCEFHAETGRWRFMLKRNGYAVWDAVTGPDEPPYFAATDWDDARWIAFHRDACARARKALAAALRRSRLVMLHRIDRLTAAGGG